MIVRIICLGALLALPGIMVAQNGAVQSAPSSSQPIRALLICGGCCHDYVQQHKILSEGIQQRGNIQVDVWWTNDKSTNPPLTVYDNVNWANGYDVIIHDECAASNKDVELVKRILKVHEKTPAVHLHCAMHSFRNGTDLWFKHLGLQSTGHGPHVPLEVEFVDREHPIVKGAEDWTIEKDELYNNAKLFDAHPLAIGKQRINRNGKETEQQAVVIWTNEKQGARSFSMSLGHYNEGVADDRYLDLVTRGTLWSCGKLSPENLVPFTGKNKVTFVESKGGAAKKAKPKPKTMPKNANLVHVSASSVQPNHEPQDVLDGDRNTRWCAKDSSYPQWIEFEFEKPQQVTEIKITWERDVAYQYKVLAAAAEGKLEVVVDDENNDQDLPGFQALPNADQPVKKIRIEGLGTKKGGWCSIREVEFKGKKLKNLWPASKEFKPLFQPTPAGKKPGKDDPYAKQGNAPPVMKRLTPEREAEILKGVKVAEGFEATVFAAPPAVNYPVFVAAAPDGTLFVSSDGNGSLGRDPKRGRVIRLKDIDGDGRADQTNVFCEVDAPRGLVWDHDRLYLMHPPHLSVFIDNDGDGVADEQNVLVKNLAFGYDKRPADHTTNGLSLGVDGYLYVAGGDFGFLNAEGADGTRLTHRGGGVIRVRPDGTGLEIYSTGTRNILEVAVSPELELFARDNTNDGGGWDVRFHHFTGGDDHGYPRLYKNFADECIAPLADYGGGSGCGAVYVDEPGFGDWNHAPFSADWGTGALYHHAVAPSGATFRETRSPQKFVQLTRPTDADVDGMSRLYCSSWKGATFKWEGADVGFIVQVKPKDFQPEPLPKFQELSNDELVGLFDSPSHRRRLESQRELIRRNDSRQEQLLTLGLERRNQPRSMVHDIQTTCTLDQLLDLAGHEDLLVQHTAIRELAKRNALDSQPRPVWQACIERIQRDSQTSEPLFRALAMMHEEAVVDELIAILPGSSAAQKKLVLKTLCRLFYREADWDGRSWGTRPDTRGPYYQPVTWQGSDRIAEIMRSELKQADVPLAAYMMETIGRNRMVDDAWLNDFIEMASSQPELVGPTISVLKTAGSLPATTLPFLDKMLHRRPVSHTVLADALQVLAKMKDPAVVRPMVGALTQLSEERMPETDLKRLALVCGSSKVVENHIDLVVKESMRPENGIWPQGFLLAVAARKNAKPLARTIASKEVTRQWKDPLTRLRLIRASAMTGNHFLDNWILDAVQDPDSELSQAARLAAEVLKLKTRKDETSKLAQLKNEQVIAEALKAKGDAGHGEVVFTKANCNACHTVQQGDKPIGPFLGNISNTYRRKELAEAILQPDKTIAQGFKTNIILDVDGRLLAGYVTEESADQIVMRDKEGKEWIQPKETIESRRESAISSMPEGLMKEFSLYDFISLLDYLQSLKN